MKLQTSSRLSTVLLAAGVLCLAAVKIRGADTPYHFLKEIPIGGEGRFDYLSVDPDSHRLYVSHGGVVVVVDTEKDAVVGQIDDTPGIHGIAIAHDLKRVFTSNGREGKVSVVDAESLKTLSKVGTGQNPDCIIYEPSAQEVYAFNGRSGSATVIDAKSGAVTATIELGGKPEFAAADPKAGFVYNNLEDKSAIAVIDVKTHKVVNTWSIAPGEEGSGLAIDREHHRLFAGCHNKMMVMVDTTSGKVAASVPIGDGVDANAFDPGTQFAFSSNGEGTVTIAHEDSPDKLTVVQNLSTERGARTMTLDTKTHKIYLAVGQSATFKVLVYGM